ncbi:pyruvate carboxylase subunit B [Chitinispirillales bacterium ANBcel5]|uniref:pyruvate carboxylase subunit B n=1 Tax=Cellulosispirillum alkaliphilum TaxID=3039283 RepID=UPI002A549CBF|nr:pyruvate carboxylase subunit B [Chitinispirillales bacterium ANBcel5]
MAKIQKKNSEDQLHKIPLRITDTTLRDAHQSLWATRMRTDDILHIVDIIDNVGYYSLEMWGGATFDVCLRFLRENPWERLRMVKAKAKNTPLQMLLRGQNLVGYRNYADDVVDRFIALACENGIDIFRVFDALNDTRNLEAAIKAVKKYGGHAQGTLCYTISPLHTVEKYVQYAKEQVALGIDSLCIKDMAGILSPIAAEKLVSALIKEVDIPIQLHCHASSGMATATYVEGVRAGAGAIDCAISSMAGYSSQPPVETMEAIFSETNYSANLDLKAMEKVAKYFMDLAPKRRQCNEPLNIIDPDILIHQIPGGMISNFRSQLQMQKTLDKLPEVLNEVTEVRKDLGYPPLVTPTSQIVGTQAVMNVIAGERYKIVPKEVRDYVKGLYGKSPAPIKKDIIKKILGDEKPITSRPADALKPMLPSATDGVEASFFENEEDILSYVLLPEPASEYFKYRALAPDERPETPAELEMKKASQKQEIEDRCIEREEKTTAQKPSQSPQLLNDTEGSSDIESVAAEVNSKIEGLKIEEIVFRKGEVSLSVRPAGAVSSIQPSGAPAQEPTAVSEPKTAQPKAQEESKQEEKTPQAKDEPYSNTINAPLVGTFYRAPGPGKPSFVKEGDVVEKGAKVCIVEAMKLFNEIYAPVKCKIVKVLVDDGQNIDKDQPMIGIEEIK